MPDEPIAVTAGAPAESPAEAALNHAAPPDASATQEELNAKIDESLGLPATKTEPPSEPQPTPENNEPAPEGAGETGDSPPEPDSRPPEPDPAPDPGALTLEVEDAAGKKYQIEKVEDLPDDFVPKNNRQVLQIISDLTKLDTKREQAEVEAKQALADNEAKANEQATLNSWDAEIVALQKDSRLDKPKATQGSPEFTQDPAVKRVDQVFKYMATENERRKPLGIAPIRSFTDALDKVELQEVKATQAEAAKKETETAKAKSGLIGRTSAGGESAPPVYRAGQARDIWDV